MPTYAYTCTACGHAFDVHQSFSDEALTVCPECSGRLRKVFSPVGVVFKGSGFYRNDARSKGGRTTKEPVGAGAPAGSPSGASSSASGATGGSSSAGSSSPASAGSSSAGSSSGSSSTAKAASA